jgi:Tfp pilus assembly protein PilF
VKKKQVKICLVIFVWLSIPLTLTAQACDLADQDQSEPCQIDSQSAIAVIESFLQQQRYVEATDQLEKILMLDPQNQTLEQAYRQLLTQRNHHPSMASQWRFTNSRWLQ